MPKAIISPKCCCIVACTCEQAKQSFLDVGLSTLTASGGPIGGPVPPAWPYVPVHPDFSYDLSGPYSTPLSTSGCDLSAAGSVLATTNGGNPPDWALNIEYNGLGQPSIYRGFTNTDPSSGTNPWTIGITGGVEFYCGEDGSHHYKLTATAGWYESVYNRSFQPFPAGWYVPPASGNDWTSGPTPMGPGQPFFGTRYTRNGNTDAQGAVVDQLNLGTALVGQYTYYRWVAATWDTDTPSVTLWSPDPAVDYSGVTDGGVTVTLT